MNAFYQVLFSLGLTVYKGNIQLMASGSWCPTRFFCKVENNVSVSFFVLNVQNVFRLKPMFSKGPSFIIPLFVIMGFEFANHDGGLASVSDHGLTSQDYIKNENVST